jgi:cytochrome c oxidase assembly protein subunit 15
MAFDATPKPAAALPGPVHLWLWSLCGLLLVMVLLGGATRLTESGLSMVEWQPLTVLPPLDQTAWQETFAKYQQSPQYRLHNTGMSLESFKGIFWLEYVHRLWGRLIGFALAVPLLIFAVKGWLPRWLAQRMAGLFVLGGLQGALGWYMVASGLVNEPAVSAYRLAAHLGLAVLLYAALLLTALKAQTLHRQIHKSQTSLRRACIAAAALVFLTIISGAFVAGLDAGLTYNTFPLMDGEWIPSGWQETSPWWRNFFESVTAVQFNHRLLALITATSVFSLALWAQKIAALRKTAVALAIMVCLQVILGISTLLLGVPVVLAVAHQGGALILWSLTLVLGAQARLAPDEVEAIYDR